MLVFLKFSDRPCSKTFYALVALKILFLNWPGGSLRNIIFNATRAYKYMMSSAESFGRSKVKEVKKADVQNIQP